MEHGFLSPLLWTTFFFVPFVQAQQLTKVDDVFLEALTPIDKPFQSIPYLKAAKQLQKDGRAQGCQRLLGLAKTDEDGKVMMLCRMLFSRKSEATFRQPLLGKPTCIGGTSPDDWPLLPLEIVDGVPFLIVANYTLLGFPESANDYVNYCIKNCEWATTRFEVVNEEAAKSALLKLLGSNKWKKPLSEFDRQFLAMQIKTR